MTTQDTSDTGPGQVGTPDSIQTYRRSFFLHRLAKRFPACLYADDFNADEASSTISRRKVSLVTESSIDEWNNEEEGAIHLHLCTWQRDWNLNDSWLYVVGRDTLRYWADVSDIGARRVPARFIMRPSNVHEGRPRLPVLYFDGVQVTPEFEGSLSVYLDDLEVSQDDDDFGCNADDGFIGSFDPRTETKATAKRRIMKELEYRVGTVLDSLIEDDLVHGATPVQRKRELEHYDWLVRVLVAGESRQGMAPSVYKDRTTVRDAVNGLAKLLGVTLPEHHSL